MGQVTQEDEIVSKPLPLLGGPHEPPGVPVSRGSLRIVDGIGHARVRSRTVFSKRCRSRPSKRRCRCPSRTRPARARPGDAAHGVRAEIGEASR